MSGAVRLLAGPPSRAQVLAFERALAELPPHDFVTRHHFTQAGPGRWLYARELEIPAGAHLTGKIHRTENFNVLSKGRIAVTTDRGVELLEAGAHLIAPAGTKRAAVALDDCIWTTFHVVTTRDLELIERELIALTFEALAETETLCLG